jgi:hypothetical protein
MCSISLLHTTRIEMVVSCAWSAPSKLGSVLPYGKQLACGASTQACHKASLPVTHAGHTGQQANFIDVDLRT